MIQNGTNREVFQAFLARWFTLVISLGFDIQPFKYKNSFVDTSTSIILASYQAEQLLRKWSQFDTIKEGGSLEEIKRLVEDDNLILTLRYRGGFIVPICLQRMIAQTYFNGLCKKRHAT